MYAQAAELRQRCQPCLQVTRRSRNRVKVEDGQTSEEAQWLQDFLRHHGVVIQQLEVSQREGGGGVCQVGGAEEVR